MDSSRGAPGSGGVRHLGRLRPVVALGLALVVLLVGAAPAGAHAQLETLSPVPDQVLDTAPSEVVLTFSETISTPRDAVRVFGPSGKRLSGVTATSEGNMMRAPLPRLTTDGSYTVAWKMVSADGHALSGAYLFHLRTATLTQPVDAASAGVATWPAVVRALGSVLALAALVWILGAASGARPDPTVTLDPAGMSTPARRRWPVWLIALAGTGLALFASVEAVGSSLTDGVDVSLETWTGRISALACGMVLVGLAVSLVRPRRRADQMIALVAVIAVALEGHAVALDPVLLSATFTVVHVLAAVSWGAGLFWLERRSRVAPASALRSDVERRSPWAMGAVLLLVVTGTVLVLERVPLGELLSTWYGRLAIVKLLLLGVAIVLALRNRVVLAPALPTDETTDETADSTSEVDDADATADAVVRLRTSVRIEMLVLAAALVAGAALAQIAPPADGAGGAGGPFDQTAAFGDGKVGLTVDPGTRGMNEVHVTALGTDGRLMTGVEDLQIQLSLSSDNIGPLTPEMQTVVVGHSISYARFPFQGEWTVLVTAKIGKFQALSAVFTVPIGP